jgi:excisionase family DNA binding protein
MDTGMNREPPLLYSIDETKRLLGLGTTTIYALLKEGALESVKCGTRTLIKGSSVRQLAEQGHAPTPKTPPIRRGPRRRPGGDEPPAAA